MVCTAGNDLTCFLNSFNFCFGCWWQYNYMGVFRKWTNVLKMYVFTLRDKGNFWSLGYWLLHNGFSGLTHLRPNCAVCGPWTQISLTLLDKSVSLLLKTEVTESSDYSTIWLLNIDVFLMFWETLKKRPPTLFVSCSFYQKMSQNGR